MKLEYSGQEQVPAPVEKVWSFVSDPKSIASCLPRVQEVRVNGPQDMDVVVQAGIGLIKGNFKFKVELEPNQAGNHLQLKISGGGLGNNVDVIAKAQLKDNGNGTTTLDWNS